jgi:putative hemolysin
VKPPINEKILAKLSTPSLHTRPPREMQEVGAPVPLEILLEEIKFCEPMFDTNPDRADKGFCVYRGQGKDIPDLMQELGRLREETFRTVGEGTGLARDLDRFDDHYDHFFAWDKSKREISGAYRIGRVDELLKKFGSDGVYTNIFFHLEPLFATDFAEGTLEAGRSFVRAEYQRGITLLIIWAALGRFIAKNPQYKYLMGPVSISNEFHENSKHLMVSYLMKYHPHEKSALVVPKTPPKFESNLAPEELTALVDAALDLNSLQEFVRHAEGDPKAQIPQLIKLYLELGVRFLAFNKDDDFNSIDGLILLDIAKIPPHILTSYMGDDGAKCYIEFY